MNVLVPPEYVVVYWRPLVVRLHVSCTTAERGLLGSASESDRVTLCEEKMLPVRDCVVAGIGASIPNRGSGASALADVARPAK